MLVVKRQYLEQLALDFGFQPVRQRGSHVRWKHSDGRATTIPLYPEMGSWLLREILDQLGATKEDLSKVWKREKQN